MPPELAVQEDNFDAAFAQFGADTTPVGSTVPDKVPPADEPPADEPPADEPPADEPPADEPPADEPPVWMSLRHRKRLTRICWNALQR